MNKINAINTFFLQAENWVFRIYTKFNHYFSTRQYCGTWRVSLIFFMIIGFFKMTARVWWVFLVIGTTGLLLVFHGFKRVQNDQNILCLYIRILGVKNARTALGCFFVSRSIRNNDYFFIFEEFQGGKWPKAILCM